MASVPNQRGFLMAEAFDYLDAPVLRVTGRDVADAYAANLEKLALPNSATSCRLRRPSATSERATCLACQLALNSL